MPTPTKGPRLGGGPAHERLILANLATALFEHGRITTTHAKAKRLRPLAERMITFAKRGDLHSRRRVLTVVRDKSVVHVLFEEIGPRFANRPGGYTRIVKIGPRKGDNAPMAVIELVEPLAEAVVAEATGATRRAAKEAAARPAAAAAGTSDVTSPEALEGGDQAAEGTTSDQTAQAGEVSQAEGDTDTSGTGDGTSPDADVTSPEAPEGGDQAAEGTTSDQTAQAGEVSQAEGDDRT